MLRDNKITHIYLITNTANGKVYVGVTNSLVSRKSHHLTAKHGNHYLARAIRKYGRDNFKIDIIYSSLDEFHCREIMEQYFIDKYNSCNRSVGYNIRGGGSSPSGFHLSSDHQRKTAKRSKERWNSNEYKEAVIACWKDHRREGLCANLKALWSKPEMRQKKSNVSKKMWGNNEFRKKHKEATSRAWGKPENRAIKSMCSRQMWENPEFRNKVSERMSKEYIIVFPDGTSKTIKNLSKFCIENNLSKSAMCQVSKGKYKQHKGFKCLSL